MTPVAIATVILALVLGAANLVLAILSGRYALQCFQQNTYRLSEYSSWFSTNWKKTSSTFITAILGICAILLAIIALPAGIIVGVIALAFTCFVIYYFNFLRTQRKKKPLVYTARVKRLVTTDIVLCVIVCAIGLALGLALGGDDGGLAWVLGIACALCLLAPLQFALVPLAGAINGPAEASNNKRYVDEARAILEDCPDLIVVGITGSYGKTSVKHYLAELLRNRYDVLITPGNFNTTLGVVRTIRERLKPTHEVFLCEMGARHKGDIAEICELVHPTLGIITSVGPAHLETFGDMATIQATKFELVDAVLATNANEEGTTSAAGTAFLNIDSAPVREQAASYETPSSFISYGTSEEASYRIIAMETSRQGTRFTVEAPDGTRCDYSTRLIGAHNVGNIAGAIAVAHKLGVPLEDMRVPVRRLRPVEHRLDLKERGDTTIIDDAYNSNPVGSKAAIDVLGLFDGRKILVTPGMVELGEQQHALNVEFATYAARVCDDVVIVGSYNRAALLEGLAQAGFPQARTHCCATIQDALQQAYAMNASEYGRKRTILMENDLPDIY